MRGITRDRVEKLTKEIADLEAIAEMKNREQVLGLLRKAVDGDGVILDVGLNGEANVQIGDIVISGGRRLTFFDTGEGSMVTYPR